MRFGHFKRAHRLTDSSDSQSLRTDTKNTFNKAYGLKFGEMDVSSDDITKLKSLFAHRHRVIHVSPIATMMLNNDLASGRQLLVDAPRLFKVFMENLHEATLSLGMADK